MSRSIFDPTGQETERSGTRFTPPSAADISHLRPEIADGTAETDPNTPDTSPELEQIAKEEQANATVADTTPKD